MSLARRPGTAARSRPRRKPRPWIVEDDYDSELRYKRPAARQPPGACDAEQRVVLRPAPFRRCCNPGIKIGYMVVPPGAGPNRSTARCMTCSGPGQLTVQAAAGPTSSSAAISPRTSGGPAPGIRRASRVLLAAVLNSQLGPDRADHFRRAAGLCTLVVRLSDRARRPGACRPLAAERGTTVAPRWSQYFIGPASASGLVVGFRLCSAGQAGHPRAPAGSGGPGGAQGLGAEAIRPHR